MKIEIWSDVVCPWCYIGKRRFEAALAEFERRHPEEEVEVAYRAFQLDPTAPVNEHEPVRAAYAKKFGGAEQASALIDHVTNEARGVGLDFAMDIAQRANTAAAHRLLALAEHHGLQHELKERLMRAYFSEGRRIGDPNELIALASEVGIDAEVARAWLQTDGGVAEVVEHLEFAAQAGITSVPTFVFDRSAGVAGAQPPEALLAVMERYLDDRPATDG